MSIIDSLFEFVRVALAFGGLYLALPYLLRRVAGTVRLSDLAAASVTTLVFAEAAVLVLAQFRLCLPGSLAAVWLVYLSAMLLLSPGGTRLWECFSWHRLVESALIRLENPAGKPAGIEAKRWRLGMSSSLDSALLVLVIGVLLGALWFPLANLRFLSVSNYSRALSLELLTRGQAWPPDSSVAFLAPVVFLSGLDATSVIRYAGPLVAALLVLSCGFCAWRLSGSRTGALGACGVAAFTLDLVTHPAAREFSGAEASAVLWLLAFAFAADSLNRSFWSAVAALLISRDVSPSLAAALFGAVTGVLVFARPWSQTYLKPLRLALVSCGLWVMFAPAARSVEEGPVQYESAARVCRRITQQFRRNDWLIVSPVHDLAGIYGRGWHVELSEFAGKFSPAEFVDPGCTFPYRATDVFVFVEKIPLLSLLPYRPQANLTGDLDPSVTAYGTSLGRASIQFQAARLMASYASSHKDVSVFYEDGNLLVYRVQNGLTQRAAGAPHAGS
jgi:hypothetical protein